MAVYVLSGRQTRVRWGIFNDPWVAFSNFIDNNAVLGRHATISEDMLIPNPHNTSEKWRTFPYVRNVTVRTEAGITEIFGLGLDSYAAMEESVIPFQEVTIDCILQPTVEVLDLINAAIRWNVTPTNYALQRSHLHFVVVRLGIVGVPKLITQESGNVLKDYGWVWDIYPGMISRVNIRVPMGGFAEFSFTLQGGYIYITSFDLSDSTQRSLFETLIPPMAYNLDAGVINNFEGVLTFHPSSAGVVSFPHTGTPATTQQPISIPSTVLTPFADMKFGMDITEFNITIDNRLSPAYTFLLKTFTDENVRKAVRTPRGVFEGVSMVNGSITALVRLPLPHETINHALAQEWLHGTTRTTVDILASFFPYTGTGAVNSVSGANPIMQFALYGVKFLNVSTGFSPQREITFGSDIRAIDFDVAIRH